MQSTTSRFKCFPISGCLLSGGDSLPVATVISLFVSRGSQVVELRKDVGVLDRSSCLHTA